MSALFLSLVLVTGVAVHGAHAAQMSATLAAAVAMDGPMPDGCDGCDPAGDSAVACALLCSALPAVVPAAPSLEPVRSVLERPVTVLGALGLHDPPDPFPPRSALAL